MNIRYISLLVALFFILKNQAQVQELSLEEAIVIAQKESFDAFKAKNVLLTEKLDYENFHFSKYPKFFLSLSPGNYSRSNQEQWNYNTESYEFVEVNRLFSNAKISLNQDIGFTGGNLSVFSNIYRNQSYGNNTSTNYNQAISISYSQSIKDINYVKWKNKTEVLKLAEANRNYIEGKESMAIKTTQLYFDLLFSQTSLAIAEINKANADSLYIIGLAKSKVGEITNNDLLNLKLKKTNAEIEVYMTEFNEKEASFTLKDFLNISREIEIKCYEPKTRNHDLIDYEKVRKVTLSNNSDIFYFNRKIIELERNIKKAKSSKYDINISANIGYNKSGEEYPNIYRNMDEMQAFNVSMILPLLTWGSNKRKIQKAEIQKEITLREKDEVYKYVEKEIFRIINQYNLQSKIINSTSKAKTISQKSYQIMNKRYVLGKASIIQINEAYRELQQAHSNYIEALKNYWVYYYSLRKLSLYDFENEKNLLEIIKLGE